MKISVFFIASLLCLAQVAADDSGMGATEYTHIQLHHVGTMKGNYQTGHILHRMEDGAKMTFAAVDPEKNLYIEADTVEFKYAAADEAGPSHILLQGNVLLKIGQNVVQSGEAEIDLELGIALFTGEPQMNTEQMKNLRAERITVNLNSGDFQVDQGEIERLDFNILEQDSKAPESEDKPE